MFENRFIRGEELAWEKEIVFLSLWDPTSVEETRGECDNAWIDLVHIS
jgi:hypothetical protein